MSAIPTKYNGTQFRSRLEARWAAFFDLLKWEWDYEPLDLRGYIPDFLVRVPRQEPLLVEVKPITTWPCPVTGCNCGGERGDFDLWLHKIASSEPSVELLIVGAGPKPSRTGAAPAIGRLAREPVAGDISVDRALVRCRRCPRYMLAEDTRGFWFHAGGEPVPDWEQFNRQRWCDCDDSDRAAVSADPTPMWRTAGNTTQWRAPMGED